GASQEVFGDHRQPAEVRSIRHIIAGETRAGVQLTIKRRVVERVQSDPRTRGIHDVGKLLGRCRLTLAHLTKRLQIRAHQKTSLESEYRSLHSSPQAPARCRSSPS